MANHSDAKAPREKALGTSEETPQGLGRRDFLQAGLLGVAATATGAVPALGKRSKKKPDDPKAPFCATSPPPPAPGPGIDPATARESWVEPWVFRPRDWPGEQLHLNVVENENQGPLVGLGNPGGVLFSYGGLTPGPTIRMRGDETLLVQVRNLLAQDEGRSAVGPAPDLATLTPELAAAIVALPEFIAAEERIGNFDPSTYQPKDFPEIAFRHLAADVREDYCIGEHVNGVHSNHVTNLHTHGLHVRPGRNPDGTHSDNVILRIIPQKDLLRREARAGDSECAFLRKVGHREEIAFLTADEQAGLANYEFRIGNVQAKTVKDQPHPPGTHWYHPHSHGATQNQVASGMAGFLIVEGDVDAALNRALTGRENPDPELKTGRVDYMERLMLIQRVNPGNVSKDPDAPPFNERRRTLPLVNGSVDSKIIQMRGGAIERWRVLNGSVDGKGFLRFMVLDGQYRAGSAGSLEKFIPSASNPTKGRWVKRSLTQIEADKQQIWKLAMDGITLVKETGPGEGRYHIKNLANQNPSPNPMAKTPADCPWPGNPIGEMLCRYENAFKSSQTVKDTFVRPNEVYMGPANRTDILFKAPVAGKGGHVYTVLAKGVIVHSDTPLQSFQQKLYCGSTEPFGGPGSYVVAHIAVSEETVEDPAVEVASLRQVLPPVPPYLRPICDAELSVHSKPGDACDPGQDRGPFRTRLITYSGWGSEGYPLVRVPEEFAGSHPELEGLVWTPTCGDAAFREGRCEDAAKTKVLLAPDTRSMAIDGRKFDPADPKRPRMWLDTAEEWAVYNSTTMLWADVDPAVQPDYQYQGHYEGKPITRAEGNRRFREKQSYQVTTRGIDHPFHIHQNPVWVMRIEIPDENGVLTNILEEPRWMDAIWIPRHTGRIVFRSRFPDYVGIYVNHCHILLHEDNGMMQVIEATPFEEQANFARRQRVATGAMTPEEVDAIYPRPSLRQAYRQSSQFVDPNPGTGQVWPGFEVPIPEDEEG